MGNRGHTVEYTVGSRKYCFEEVTWFEGLTVACIVKRHSISKYRSHTMCAM